MQPSGFLGQHGRIDRISGGDRHPGLENLRGQPTVLFDAHERKAIILRLTPLMPSLPLAKSRLIQCQARKPGLLLPGRRRAWLYRFEDIAEIRGPEGAELRSNQNVTVTELLDLPQGIFADEYRQHLLGDRYRRLQLVELIQGKLDVHGDHDVDAHVTDDVYRQVADQPAVDQQVTIEAHRRQHAGHGHARPNRKREVAALHDVHLARFDVGRDCAKRNRQVVEIRDTCYRQGQVAQYEIELLALHHAERQLETPALEPDVEGNRKIPCILLAAESQVAALGLVGHRVGPVHFRDQHLERVNADPRCVKTTDDRTHAGTGDGVDRDTHPFELSEYTDVCGSARTATTEHQSYSGPFRWRNIVCLLHVPGIRQRRQQHSVTEDHHTP